MKITGTSEMALVLVSPTVRGQTLLEDAAAHAECAGADLVLYAIVSRAEQDTRQTVDRLASRVLPGRDVEFTVQLERPTGDVARQVLAAAEERDCDRLFVLSQPRSGLRSRLGRDPLLELVEEFDGLVTAAKGSTPAEEPAEEVQDPENLNLGAFEKIQC